MGTSTEDWASFRRAGDAGWLNVRIFSYSASIEPMLAIAAGEPTPWLYGDKLRMAGVKLYADGALGSRGAWLKQPYADKPGERGLQFLEDAKLRNLMSRAAMDGFQVARLESVIETVDIFITATGNTHIIRPEHLLQMKHLAVVANVGHFDDEVDTAGISQIKGVEKVEIKPQVHEWRMPNGRSVLILSEGRLMNLGNATGHPSFVMSNSFSNQVLAQIELFTKTENYPVGVYVLPKSLDEKVAKLHLAALGVELTELTNDQARYIGVSVNGPFKVDHYRY